MRPLVLLTTLILSATAQPANLHLPAETVGLDSIVRTLVDAFDHVDVIALGEAHGQFAIDSDLRLALVRHPAFPTKVRSIVVEFASTTEQATLDRYLQGHPVSPAQLAQVWKSTTQAAGGLWDSPAYANFLATVRDLNRQRPPAQQIRVLGGDPGPTDTRSRETAALAVLEQHVLARREKALVLYGAAHFYRRLPPAYLATLGEDQGLARLIEARHPGRTLVVLPLGLLPRPPAVRADVPPDFDKVNRAVKTPLRPVLLRLARSPFADLSASEFLGRTLTTCRGPAACVSGFQTSPLTLSQLADACLYVGVASPAP